MKKFVSTLMVFVMVLASSFFSPALTSATSSSDQVQTSECACNAGKKKVEKEEALFNLANEGVAVKETLSQQEIAKVDKAVKKSDALKDALKDIEKKGFKQVKDSEVYVTMENLPMGNKMFESVTFVDGIMQSKYDKDTVIAYEAIVDNTLQEVIKYQVTEVKNGQYKVLHTFQQEMTYAPTIDWTGVQCDWVAVILCAHHCYLWTAAGWIGAGICEVICLTTTVLICNW